jgi:uncharacterized membrane protein YesL
LLWSLAWLTILLGPPVTFGIHYVENLYIRGENLGLRGLWEGTRKYFIRSWLWMLANLGVGLLLYSSSWAYGQIGGIGADIGQSITLVIAAGWFTIQFYAVPILMIQTKPSLREAWRNSLLMTLASPPYLFVLLIFLALFGLISLLLIFPTILGYTTLLCLLANQAVRDRLETFQALLSEAKKPTGESR